MKLSCFLKFLDEPQVTNLKVEFNGNEPLFPTMTICNKPHESWNKLTYNLTKLKSCNITSIEEYKMGNWIGNCSDPKQLFEDAVAKSHQIVNFVHYHTFDDKDQEKDEIVHNYTNKGSP